MKRSQYIRASLIVLVFLLACQAKQTGGALDKAQTNDLSQTATDRRTLKSFRQLWEKNEPTHYRYKFSCECQCKFSTYYAIDKELEGVKQVVRGKWLQVEVKDGKFIAAYYEDGVRDDKYHQNTSGENPLTHLFRLVEAAIETGAKKLIVGYNKERGFIEKVSIDLSDALDDEREFLIKDYEILAP